MFDQLLVPVDLSPISLESVAVATRMASAMGVERVSVLHAVERIRDVGRARDCLAAALDRRAPRSSDVIVDVVVEGARTPAGAINSALDERPGTLCVMGSHGHGRSAAVLGSTTDELLRWRFRPIVVVGPNATRSSGRLDGTYVVPLDGSSRADRVLPIVAAWTRAFHGSPRLVHVETDRCAVRRPDARGVTMLGERRRIFDRWVSSDTQCSIELVDDVRVGHGVASAAASHHASLAFLATHGRSGIGRLRSGSVAAEIIRRLSCPAVLFRPPSSDR